MVLIGSGATAPEAETTPPRPEESDTVTAEPTQPAAPPPEVIQSEAESQQTVSTTAPPRPPAETQTQSPAYAQVGNAIPVGTPEPVQPATNPAPLSGATTDTAQPTDEAAPAPTVAAAAAAVAPPTVTPAAVPPVPVPPAAVAAPAPVAGPEPSEAPVPADPEKAALLRRRAVIAVIIILVAIGLGTGAIVLGRHSGAHRAVQRPLSANAPANFVTYRDPADGFSIGYPRTWTRVVPPGNGLALLLNVSGQDAVSVRLFGLQSAVRGAKDLAAIKSVTDGILGTAGTNIQILHQQTFTLNGMPGYYYLYTFPGTNGGPGGVHAQYFLFQGRTMNELVFQAVPASDFPHLAPVFDQVANTFHSSPSFVPPAPTTTAPNTTPAPSSTGPATPAPGASVPPPGH